MSVPSNNLINQMNSMSVPSNNMMNIMLPQHNPSIVANGNPNEQRNNSHASFHQPQEIVNHDSAVSRRVTSTKDDHLKHSSGKNKCGLPQFLKDIVSSQLKECRNNVTKISFAIVKRKFHVDHEFRKVMIEHGYKLDHVNYDEGRKTQDDYLYRQIKNYYDSLRKKIKRQESKFEKEVENSNGNDETLKKQRI
mmetsp:Transcript_15290/g.18611  ORF Transcript_15290/g.18611 Transcript_15290/m.18611 type:complete len:193 (-) Transcript_15290:274-852(-)